VRFSRLVLAAAVPLSVAVAQASAAPASPAQSAPDIPTAVPARVEISGGGGVGGTSPAIGMLASFPLGERLSLDAGADYLFRVFRSPAYVLAQAQLRIPFRAHLRSRYSLLVGVTHLEALDPREGDSPLWREDGVNTYPHAGASMQWSLGQGLDLRVDAQLIVQGGELIPVVPRAVGSFVWSPGGAR